MKFPISKKAFIWTLIVAIAVLALALGLYFGLKDKNKSSSTKGAIVSNGIPCAQIGENILEDGGSAVDAAIATLFCEGVVVPQSMGIGGGFLATIYKHNTKQIITLNARESAPLASTEDMFVNVTSISGINATAVPGEVLGYWEMHKRYGSLPWKKLIQPSIELSRNGFKVSKHMANALKSSEAKIKNEPTMSEIFIDPSTGNVWIEGDTVKRVVFAETLEIIANEGADSIYNGGNLGKRLVQDIKNLNGIITEEDFKEYKVNWSEPTVSSFYNGYKVYSSPLPGSGAVLSFILNLMNDLLTDNTTLIWTRLIEVFKHAYGQRTQLGDLAFEPTVEPVYRNLTDPKFADYIRQFIFDNETFTDYAYYGANFTNSEDHGTANMAVLAPNGDAITVTSTVNQYFGTKLRSVSTGIIFNDEMDDFSTPGVVNGFGIPASPANFIKPKKRPMSSMCPTIVVNSEGNVELLVGAAGGSKITTAVAQAIIRYLFLNDTIDDAVQASRIHHQLAPMLVEHEYDYNKQVLSALAKIGHQLQAGTPESGFAAMTAIGAKNFEPVPVFDRRRLGSTSVTRTKNKMNH